MIELSQSLLDALRCPESGQALRIADDAILEQVNARIAEGALHNCRGAGIDAPLEAALCCEDGSRLYPVRDGFPILLIDEAIDL